MDTNVDGDGLRLQQATATTGGVAHPGAALHPAANLAKKKKKQTKRRAFWMKQLHQWHWISAAVSLIGMLLFAITGITLNHAAKIEARPQVVTSKATLPDEFLAPLAAAKFKGKKPLPDAAAAWVEGKLPARVQGKEAEWSDGEIYVALPRPGGDAWLSIELDTGEVVHEATSRGWVSYLNDLHKGRHTGDAWSWFIDLFAVACVIFCVTGVLLLQVHAVNRPMTWPTVALGLVIPMLLAIFFMH